MKIIYIIEAIEEGGKERRLLELIKWLSKDLNLEIILVTMGKEIYYTDFYNLNISIKILLRKNKYNPFIIKRFYSICKQVKPDVIHSWGSIPSLYAIPSVILLKIPLIDGQITSAPHSIKIFSRLWLIKNITFFFATKIVSNSISGLKSYNAPDYKSLHIYNGFDFNRLENLKDANIVKRELNIKTKYVIGMVASFSDSKDYDTFFTTAIKLCKLRKDVSFISIGTGKNFDFYKKIINEAKLDDNIFFMGKVLNVEEIISIFDIGLLTSYTEGISNSILEYMALKKPVIATDCLGNREIISHKRDGLLIPVGDHHSLLHYLVMLLNDYELRSKLGTNAHNKVKTQFSKSKMLNAFVNVYRTVIDKK